MIAIEQKYPHQGSLLHLHKNKRIMKKMLFPHCFQKPGWIIFAISALLGTAIMFEIIPEALMPFFGKWGYCMNNVAIIGTIIGGIMATCSREKIEDEMISSIRLESLLTALYVNYGIMIIASLFVYGLDFLYVMLYGMFTILIIFMVVFRWKIWRIKNEE